MAFRCQRWTLANILPVAFVSWIIGTIWLLYLWLHLLPLLQLYEQPEFRDVSRRTRGLWEAAVSQLLTLMLLICFVRAIITDPGSIPELPEWRHREDGSRLKWTAAAADESLLERPAHHEVKQTTGERRFCKWCDRYKPDRCHHCRVCRSCILRMDHHCPWIANCVGFRNHKYFFLLVLYALLNCAFVIVTMSESVARAVTEETPPTQRFLLVFCMTLSVIMALLLKLFFSLHVWLMMKATTTIELCEKRQRRSGGDLPVAYELGAYENIKAVLGPNVLLWLVPLSPPEGDGLYFRLAPSACEKEASAPSETTALLADQDQEDHLADEPGPDAAVEPEKATAAASATGAASSSAAPEVTGERAAAV